LLLKPETTTATPITSPRSNYTLNQSPMKKPQSISKITKK